MQRGQRQQGLTLAAARWLAVVALAVVALGLAAARASAGPADQLASDDPRVLGEAVTAIEHGPADPDALLAAARACEQRLLDPARALALYERIVRELPQSGQAVTAARRIDTLRAEVGASGQFTAEVAERARLVAGAEQLPADEVVRRGDALAAEAWPGAPGVARWLGDWLCRHGRYDEAQARYARDGSPEATSAAAQCALAGHDWARAEALAARLPDDAPGARALRQALLDGVMRERARARWLTLAWLGLVLALAALVASFAEAQLRGPRASLARALRPPVEIAYLAPIAAVLVAIAFTAHQAIAPAVLRITLAGLVATWLSGAALDRLRARGRPLRARALVHIAACAIAVVAAGYLAIVHDGLLDLLSETVRFGPGS